MKEVLYNMCEYCKYLECDEFPCCICIIWSDGYLDYTQYEPII